MTSHGFALLGLDSGGWSALGAWATIIVYIVLAGVAWRQLAEARSLRLQQSRPYVIADVHGKSTLVFLVFKNVGATQAQNVLIKFDGRLVGSTEERMRWQDSPAFTSGVPSMAPGANLRFFFDSFPDRDKAGLPTLVSGTITYSDAFQRPYEDRFVIDLAVYRDALEAEKDIGDLVHELSAIRKALEKR